MKGQILKSRIRVPSKRRNHMSRPRLTELLNSSDSYRLVLLCAPSGFGKTSALVEWIRINKRPVAWISWRDSDNDLDTFIRYLLAAIQSSPMEWQLDVRDILPRSGQFDAEDVLTVLLNEIEQYSRPMSVVMDDFHRLIEPKIHDAVTFLLENAPPNLHLIISSHTIPSIPVGRFKVDGDVFEIGMGNLSFTLVEADQFCRESMGMALENQDVATLHRMTEGWIAGLQLTTLFWKDGGMNRPDLPTFSGSHDYVVDYLVSEVLQKQSDEIRQFLLETSVLTDPSAPLCDYLMQITNSGRILQLLEENNLFITNLDREHRLYRYHTLFSQSLVSILKKSSPERVTALHHRASEWYEIEGLYPQAVEHAFQAEDQSRVIHLIETYSESILLSGNKKPIITWLKRLSDEQIDSRVRLKLADIVIQAAENRPDAFEQTALKIEDLKNQLEEIRRTHENPSESFQKNLLRIPYLLDLLLIYSASETNQTPDTVLDLCRDLQKRLADTLPEINATIGIIEAISYIRMRNYHKAVEILEGIDLVLKSGSSALTAVYSSYFRIWIALTQGNLNRAESIAESALDLIGSSIQDKDTQVPVIGGLELLLGETALERNQKQNAMRHTISGLSKIRETAEFGMLVKGYELRARIAQAFENDTAEATRCFRQIEFITHRRPHADRYAASLNLQLMLNRVVRNQDREHLKEAGLFAKKQNLRLETSGGTPAHFQEESWRRVETLAVARLYLFQQIYDLEEKRDSALEYAEVVIQQAYDGAERRGLNRARINFLIWMALGHQFKSEYEDAAEKLGLALSLANAEGYIRLFVDQGRPMLKLLSRFDTSHPQRQYIETLIECIQVEVKQDITEAPHHVTDGLTVSPLSKREQEILRLIEQGLSNKEIAAQLFLSLSTIKSHLTNIFIKLDVRKRTAAVVKAREYNMI